MARRVGRGFENAMRELGAATRAYQKAVKYYAGHVAGTTRAENAMSRARVRLNAAQLTYQQTVAEVERQRVAATQSGYAASVRQGGLEPLRGIVLREESQ